jgi:hypothetical protein
MTEMKIFDAESQKLATHVYPADYQDRYRELSYDLHRLEDARAPLYGLIQRAFPRDHPICRLLLKGINNHLYYLLECGGTLPPRDKECPASHMS